MGATEADSNWVTLARIVRPQGRRGELLADILTDFPDSLGQRKRLFLRQENGRSGDNVRPASVEGFWRHKGRIVLKLAGVDSIGDAERLRGFDIVVPLTDRMPLTDDAVYVSDLIGARVVDVGRGAAEGVGKDAGEVVDVMPEGSGPAMLVLRSGAGEPVLIPFVSAYLRRIDLAEKRIEMALPEGLLTINAPLTEEERESMRKELKRG